MSELRWILLVAGVIVVAWIYWRGRREQRRREQSIAARIEPVVRATDIDLDAEIPPRTEPRLETPVRPAPDVQAHTNATGTIRAQVWKSDPATEAPPPRRAAPPLEPKRPAPPKESAPKPATKIVALRIARREGKRIQGAQLIDVLGGEGLEYGEHKIFHRYIDAPENGQRTPVFSVANMVEPGELDPAVAGSAELSGLTMFMVLPGARDGATALADMLGTARRIATAIDAEVLDRNGSTMTRQTAEHLRDEVIEFEHHSRYDSRSTALDR
jgi:cell division protein ZipA